MVSARLRVPAVGNPLSPGRGLFPTAFADHGTGRRATATVAGLDSFLLVCRHVSTVERLAASGASAIRAARVDRSDRRSLSHRRGLCGLLCPHAAQDRGGGNQGQYPITPFSPPAKIVDRRRRSPRPNGEIGYCPQLPSLGPELSCCWQDWTDAAAGPAAAADFDSALPQGGWRRDTASSSRDDGRATCERYRGRLGDILCRGPAFVYGSRRGAAAGKMGSNT